MRFFECHYNDKKIFNPRYYYDKTTLFKKYDDAVFCTYSFMKEYYPFSKVIERNWDGFFTRINENNTLEIKRINVYSEINPIKNKIVLDLYEDDIRKLKEIKKDVFIKQINKDYIIYYDDLNYDLYEGTSIKFNIERNLDYGYYLLFDLSDLQRLNKVELSSSLEITK